METHLGLMCIVKLTDTTSKAVFPNCAVIIMSGAYLLL